MPRRLTHIFIFNPHIAMHFIRRLFDQPSARRLAAFLLVAAIAPATHAQSSAASAAANPGATARTGASAAVNAVVQRARVMADAGEGTRARQLLDSLVNGLPRESHDAAEALYWRALMSDETAPAELDWKRIVVESPFSPRASDALLRLSELNLMRNNQKVARQNVQQLLADHPDAPERPRALLLLARSYFDERDAPRGCGVLTAVRREAPLSAVEVRLQADEMQQQCRNVREVALGAEPDATTIGAPVGGTPPAGATSTPPGTLTAQTAALPPATGPPANATATVRADSIKRAAANATARSEAARNDSIARESTRRDSTTLAAATRKDAAARAAITRSDSIARVAAARKDSTTQAAIMRNDSIARIATARADSLRAVIARDSELRDSLRKVYAARDSAAGITTARDRARRDSATRVANTVDSLAAVVRGTAPAGRKTPATRTAAKTGRFTVQVAAYKTRAQANTLARKLNASRLNAFVAGTKQPFRVNIGRYATRAEATEALVALKQNGQRGFVTEVPPA